LLWIFVLGSAVVSTAVFGVPPKTFGVFNSKPFGIGEIVVELAGGTPATATETVRYQPHCSG
jgi:hypothetical protein